MNGVTGTKSLEEKVGGGRERQRNGAGGCAPGGEGLAGWVQLQGV